MKKRNLILLVAITLVFALVLCACSKGASYRSIKIFSFKGTCNIFRGKEELSLAKEMKIKNNDELRVKDDSQAILKLDSDKFVCVKENTNVKFVASGKENNTKTRLHVLNGGVVVEVKEKLKDSETFEIASSNSVMAIRGTQISFDVEYLGDMITTTFSILKGQTETFLYKDETMNSKLLVHDKMMSYTTALIKTTDEIYKIYDTLEKVEISDSDLETVYDTKIEAISNKKIDEIVNATNEFERENEKVNKTIGITVPGYINYGVNPKDVIQFYDIINELENVKYLYSQNADGEFTEVDNLTLGKWYVKVIADNAYESSVWEFKVIREKIEFSIPSRVEYSDNLLNKVTGVEREFDIQYSDSYAGTYTLYNPTTPLVPGEYYIKLQNDYITSEPTLVEIQKKTITLDIPSSIEYASDLNLYNHITSNVSEYEIYMISDKTAQAELYNPTNALELGDYKIYLKKDNDYYINSFVKTFKIVKININFDYDETFEYGDNVADHIRNVSMDDYEIHYSTEA